MVSGLSRRRERASPTTLRLQAARIVASGQTPWTMRRQEKSAPRPDLAAPGSCFGRGLGLGKLDGPLVVRLPRFPNLPSIHSPHDQRPCPVVRHEPAAARLMAHAAGAIARKPIPDVFDQGGEIRVTARFRSPARGCNRGCAAGSWPRAPSTDGAGSRRGTIKVLPLSAPAALFRKVRFHRRLASPAQARQSSPRIRRCRWPPFPDPSALPDRDLLQP